MNTTTATASTTSTPKHKPASSIKVTTVFPEGVAVTPSKPRRDPPMKARLERGHAKWLRLGKRHHGDP